MMGTLPPSLSEPRSFRPGAQLRTRTGTTGLNLAKARSCPLRPTTPWEYGSRPRARLRTKSGRWRWLTSPFS